MQSERWWDAATSGRDDDSDDPLRQPDRAQGDSEHGAMPPPRLINLQRGHIVVSHFNGAGQTKNRKTRHRQATNTEMARENGDHCTDKRDQFCLSSFAQN